MSPGIRERDVIIAWIGHFHGPCELSVSPPGHGGGPNVENRRGKSAGAGYLYVDGCNADILYVSPDHECLSDRLLGRHGEHDLI